MKLTSLLAALAFLCVTGCSDSDDNSASAYPAIPQNIDLDKSTLSSISDSDYDEGKSIFKALTSLVSVDNQLFTFEENDEDRRKREDEWAKLNDQQKALIEDLRAQCKIVENNPEGDWSGMSVGATMPLKNTASANGAKCKTNSTYSFNGLLKLLSIDDSKLNGDIGGQISLVMKSSFDDANSQKLMGYSSYEFSGSAEARVKIVNGEDSSSYIKLQGKGSFDLVDEKYKTILMTVKVEHLSKRSDNTLMMNVRVELSVEDKSYVFSKVTRIKADQTKSEELYLGNRLIPKAEVDALGDLPLEIDSVAK